MSEPRLGQKSQRRSHGRAIAGLDLLRQRQQQPHQNGTAQAELRLLLQNTERRLHDAEAAREVERRGFEAAQAEERETTYNKMTMALEAHLSRTRDMVQLLKKKDLARPLTLRLRRAALGADVLYEMHKLSPSHMLFAPIYVEYAEACDP